MNAGRIRIWDVPTRLFHWMLVLSVAAAIVTGKVGGNLMVWHGRIGLLIVGLLAFRLAWGIVGSTYARFAQFLPTPRKLVAYLKGTRTDPGHSPLGALAVFAFLGLLLVQAATGLVSNDDIAFYGPLYELVGRAVSNRLTGIHQQLPAVLMAMVALHVSAIVFYAVRRNQNLVKPIITGWKEDSEGEPARGGGLPAFVIGVFVSPAAVYGAAGAWIQQPPPSPEQDQSTPDW
ncbi:MAG TPA: cytochrome b/b6 domain-containing protein [Noviherbaspirillum sp.]|nr:cytochrome b/b6 domain-containing protein [Noviherbaspirillum sp.]